MSEFKGKVALVTGGGTGIGRATALDFAEKGANVMIADVNVEEGRKTVDLITAAAIEHTEAAGTVRASGRGDVAVAEKTATAIGEASFIEADISREKDVANMVAETIKIFGRLDYACNNAGIEGIMKPTAELTLAEWQRVIDVNLSGVFLSMKHEIPEILKQGGGAIVNMASILGQVAFANASAYTAAKHGVIGLTKTAALEYSAQGLRVNAVCPAFIVTPMLERAGITSNPDMRKAMEAMHPIDRMGQPEEIAKTVTWLCSDDASFITGEALLVDGGYVAQ